MKPLYLYSAFTLLNESNVKRVHGWKEMKVNLKDNEGITAWREKGRRVEGPCEVWIGEAPSGVIHMEKDGERCSLFPDFYPSKGSASKTQSNLNKYGPGC